MANFKSSAMMWAGLLLGSLAGFVLLVVSSRLTSLLDLTFVPVTRAGVQHWLLLVVVVTLTVSLVGAPFIRFLDSGWQDRFDEFRSRLRDGAIIYYLRQFWQRRVDDNPGAVTSPAAAERLLNDIYIGQYGRRGFIAPIILLLLMTFTSVVLVAQTGIDACIERRCLSATAAVAVGHFAPLGDITLPKATAAAIGGAFLFVVGDAILRARRRTMNVSDVYWYDLRILLSVPIGLAFSETASPALASLVSFGLGAFPIDSLMRLLRRLTNKAVGAGEEAQEVDQLVHLDGVTIPISTTLAAEGIESIDELVGIDPVVLSIRSGIPFPSLLRFASQAVVRMHLGGKAEELIPLGLGNAYQVGQFVTDLDEERETKTSTGAEQRLDNAVTVLRSDKNPTVPSKPCVEACFRAIADHGYTQFLRAMG